MGIEGGEGKRRGVRDEGSIKLVVKLYTCTCTCKMNVGLITFVFLCIVSRYELVTD